MLIENVNIGIDKLLTEFIKYVSVLKIDTIPEKTEKVQSHILVYLWVLSSQRLPYRVGTIRSENLFKICRNTIACH